MNLDKSSGCEKIIAQAICSMKEEQGLNFSLEKINLAELERRTGLSRGKLRRLKANGFNEKSCIRKVKSTVLSGYTNFLDSLLTQGITNSNVCFARLKEAGYLGGKTSIKNYIAKHKDLVPAKRQIVAPQGNRGRRYSTGPGEAYQMDWGFTYVEDCYGNKTQVACFVMICHHCGERYVEFFPNAKQENLFIGMIHAFQYMGVPKYVLTDNMKSVVIKRDAYGNPIWQKDYEAFMKEVGFQTKLCKPYHPFTKGKVERLVRFVKENFLVGRSFWNITDLNLEALKWCNEQNTTYRKALGFIPLDIHLKECMDVVHILDESNKNLLWYLCPERKISFDGFINYEGRRFGVPYSYYGKTARIMRNGETITIYSSDLKKILTTHEVTWSRRDRFCEDQYVSLQPEERPTAQIKTFIAMLEEPLDPYSFEKFNFDYEEDQEDE